MRRALPRAVLIAARHGKATDPSICSARPSTCGRVSRTCIVVPAETSSIVRGVEHARGVAPESAIARLAR
jgi:hypothetical protein